tara:strand:+ start:1223 stop:2326 length:1104 start_codon:yes stop_codon:yes gene_type:complete
MIISDTTSFNWQNSQTESEDFLQTNNALNLILGEINDPIFGLNVGAFYTQILLAENNIDLGTNPIVDSVILSYTYTGSYGSFNQFNTLQVSQIYQDIYKDSTYYNNSFDLSIDNIDNIEDYYVTNDSNNPLLKIKLKNNFGQNILDLGTDILKDNESFLQEFKGISVLASADNFMLYLNPNDVDSYLKIYYHNNENISDTLSLDFELGGDATRINLFNDKNLNNILDDSSKIYIQSMAGYKLKILLDKPSINLLLDNKVINKVNIIFEVEDNSQTEYEAHEKLVLVRVNNQANNVFLEDYIEGGDVYFGGNLDDGKYIFNITKYFFQMLNNELYTNQLYLLPAGAAVNANRTILNKEIKLNINYTEL